MFLKRIEMHGFKSFADKIVIDFDYPVTGIVGPNGCGKSNISDAIRWVLGEQSVKSLRGDKMTDVIFAGAEGRKALNMAEVTLVFDNKDHLLNSELEEIEVTRRIYATEQEAEYLINHKNVRLRDIQDLILDTGLGKDSLSMITQGNITQFAEAKPFDRRAIFEEAAGVSKYKKRKNESLSKLQRTSENLDRAKDILDELERQVNPLKRQAHKAELYREKKARLEQIEVAVLVNDIYKNNEEKDEIGKELFTSESNVSLQNTTIQIQENVIIENKNVLRQYDREINQLSDLYNSIVNDVVSLEKRKVEIDQKRKYALETGNDEEKLASMSSLVSEAKLEYDDRSSRLMESTAELDILNNNLSEIALEIADASLKKEEQINIVRVSENRIELLKNVLKDPFSSSAQSGVKAIMTNKSSFTGIMGVVGQEIHPLEGYEEAISTALAGAVFNIVTRNEEAARNAIAFLKKNRSGRATFLPITALRSRYLKREDEIICKNTAGFIGTAAEFANNSIEFDIVRESLLGNVIITDNLENANNLASLLHYGYRIVTLEGDVVNKGGSMTGGRIKNEVSLLTVQSELNRLNREIVSHRANRDLLVNKYNALAAQKNALESQIIEKRVAIAKIEPVVEAKKAKYEKLLAELEGMNLNSTEQVNAQSDSIITKLNEAQSKRDKLSLEIKLKRDERNKLSLDNDRKEQQIRLLRRQVDAENIRIRSLSERKAVIETRMENSLNRLAGEYHMTYDYALENIDRNIDENANEEVIALRNEIQALGNINMSAPEEYEEINKRYEFIKKNYDDLIASRDMILKTIEEMDAVMKKQFKETFDKINHELPFTFASFFGGGKAKLVLEDEDDILNSGIDIDVQPPGKNVKSIRLFSGGEKTLIAICVLFTILKIRPVPLIVFDEVEAPLDQANVERFAKYVKNFENDSQFLIITHRPGTMAQADVLYGVTMQKRGVSELLKVKLVDAINMAEKEEENS